MGQFDINLDQRITNLENQLAVIDKYDTGWVYKTDWTNSQVIITHNLNSELAGLSVDIYVALDPAANDTIQKLENQDDGVANCGLGVHQNGVNAINLEFGLSGVTGSFTGGSVAQIASNYYYRIVIYKPKALSFLRASLGAVGSYRYSTGWVENSDWVKNAVTIAHNLGASLTDLVVEAFVSSTADDTNAYSLTGMNMDVAAAGPYGNGLVTIDDDSFYLVLGSDSGMTFINQNGDDQSLAAQTWYYKCVVYKPDVLDLYSANFITTAMSANTILSNSDLAVIETRVNITVGSNNLTLQIPDGNQVSLNGKIINLVQVDAGAGDCTVSVANSGTINGTDEWLLNGQWQRVRLQCDGNEWKVLDCLGTLLIYENAANVSSGALGSLDYNNPSGHSLSIPSGEWAVDYDVGVFVQDAAVSQLGVVATLSTSSTAENDGTWSSGTKVRLNSGYHYWWNERLTKSGFLTVSSTTTYYLLIAGFSNASPLATVRTDTGTGTSLIRARRIA